MARPPLRPAAFFWAVVPSCDELLREEDEEPDFLPPRLEAPDEFAIFAARSFDVPASFSFSYCFSFSTFERLPGVRSSCRMEELPDARPSDSGIAIRLLEPGDEAVVRGLATYHGPGDPEALLADHRTLMLVAFDGEQPVGFVLAHELPRRHGEPSTLFIYEVDVAETQWRRGIASALLGRLAVLARERGIQQGFVLAAPDNCPANALYPSIGGKSELNVLWDFTFADG